MSRHTASPLRRVNVLVTDPATLTAARRLAVAVALRADRSTDPGRRTGARRVLRAGGDPVVVDRSFARLLALALAASRSTGGLLDPTVGAALLRHRARTEALDVAARTGLFPACSGGLAVRDRPAPGADAVRVEGRRVTAPAGTVLDLGATTDALVVRAAAAAVADRLGTGVLVELGGDVAAAGPTPAGGWGLRLPDGAVLRLPPGRTAATVRPAPDRPVVDPRTGSVVDDSWACVTVLHADLVTAKALALGAVVLRDAAPGWLARRGVAFRLVARDREVTTSPAWPRDVRSTGVPAPRVHAVAS